MITLLEPINFQPTTQLAANTFVNYQVPVGKQLIIRRITYYADSILLQLKIHIYPAGAPPVGNENVVGTASAEISVASFIGAVEGLVVESGSFVRIQAAGAGLMTVNGSGLLVVQRS